SLVVNPIVKPALRAEFVVIQPARRTLSVPARLFLERFEAEVANIHAIWDRALAAPVAANGGRRRSGRNGRRSGTPETLVGRAAEISSRPGRDRPSAPPPRCRQWRRLRRGPRYRRKSPPRR